VGEGSLPQQELASNGIKPGSLGTAGLQEPCYTSVPSPRPDPDVTQEGGQGMSETDVPQARLDPVDLASQDEGPPMSEAGRFGGGRYPTRVRASGAPKWYESTTVPPAETFTTLNYPSWATSKFKRTLSSVEPNTYFEASQLPRG